MGGDKRLVVGEILSAHGIKGGVWVKPLTSQAGRGRDLKDVFLVKAGDAAPARILAVREVEDRWIVSFEGITSREEAEGLKGWAIEVAEKTAPPQSEGTFYVHDLIGREVATEEGEYLGQITNVFPTGANDVYVIEGPGGELLFPALRELVVDCPRGGHTMRVRLLPGLLEACLHREA
jgi:16S rRNA processing protein RimM